ncbi:MAG: hypothetical protein UT13_C0001G0558 [Candidatus Pacebacteria bacterium GW2011_GWF2_38_9]|nr:MAG: hypothetical protein US01_C0001G0571 [candidate division TM6 bacterium GW2011_GWF2_28_16]KKQ07351.1 MAG: hypothetical protein US20_C0041G0004 [Candidatus Pacebacteria bacterium GW2011_GWF1_36_5]KKQ88911.1 MAG: hypothetical protein UT13_C0001G0558 [Candidatus Pacebacteria bacterium GW2011_GWF2_38_9]HAZ73087.1 hypothetical protein [Candidatus Paceibacterota bacterium]
MKFFLISLVFLLSLGQLQRIQITNNIAFYLHDSLIVAFLLKELFTAIVQRKKIIEKLKKINILQKKIFWGFLATVFLAWVLAIFEGRFDFRAILYSIRLITYVCFVFLLQKKLKGKNWLWRLVSFNILLLGFLQYFFLPDLRFLIYEGYDDHLYRLVSTILDPAFTGLIFVFNLNYYLWQKKKNWFFIIPFAIGLLLTYSRSSYLAFLLSSLILMLIRKDLGKRAVLLVLISFFASLPFLPKQSGGDGVNLLRTTSAEARISNDQMILRNMNKTDWIFGQGLFIPNQNRQTVENIPSHSHFADNLLVFLLSNLGVIGSSLFIILVWQLTRSSKKENLALLASLISHAMFNNNFTQSFVLLIFLGFSLSDD